MWRNRTLLCVSRQSLLIRSPIPIYSHRSGYDHLIPNRIGSNGHEWRYTSRTWEDMNINISKCKKFVFASSRRWFASRGTEKIVPSDSISSTDITNANLPPSTTQPDNSNSSSTQPIIRPLSVGSSTFVSESSTHLGPPGRLMIYASEVSAIVGMNPFAQIHEIFERIWQRTEPEGYKSMIARVEQLTGRKILSRDEEAILILATPEASQLSKELEQVLLRLPSLSAADLDQEKRSLKVRANSSLTNLSEQQMVLLVDYLHSQVSKQYGIQNELSALKAYELIADLTVIDNNRLFYGREIGMAVVEMDDANEPLSTPPSSPAETSDVIDPSFLGFSPSPPSPPSSTADTSSILLRRSIWLGGRVDGFSSVTGHLIEMKNRTKRFLTPLPLYDRCQMEVYLQVTEREEGELVERLRKKVSKEEAEDEQRRLAFNYAQPEGEQDLSFTTNAAAIRDVIEDIEFLGVTVRTRRNPPLLSRPDPAIFNPTINNDDVDPVDESFLSSSYSSTNPAVDETDTSFLVASPSPPTRSARLSTSTSSTVVGIEHLSFQQSITHILIQSSTEPEKESEEELETETATKEDLQSTDDSFMESSHSSQPSSELLTNFLAAAAPEIVDDSTTTSVSTAASITSTHVPPSPPTPIYIDRLKRTLIKRNDSVWSKKILPPLHHFSHFVTRALADTHWQMEYLKCETTERKSAMIKEIIPEIVHRRPNGTAKSFDANTGNHGARGGESRTGGKRSTKHQMTDE